MKKENNHGNVWSQVENGNGESPHMTTAEYAKAVDKKKRIPLVILISLGVLLAVMAAAFFIFFNVPFRHTVRLDGEKTDHIRSYVQAGATFVSAKDAFRTVGYDLTPTDTPHVYSLSEGDMMFLIDMSPEGISVMDREGNKLMRLFNVYEGFTSIRPTPDEDDVFLQFVALRDLFSALHLSHRIKLESNSWNTLSLSRLNLENDTAAAMVSAIRSVDYDSLRELAKAYPDAAVCAPSVTAEWWHEYVVVQSGDHSSAAFRLTPLPPLHLAASTGDAEAVRILIDAGANVNVTDEYEYETALGLCLRPEISNHSVIAGLLLDAGASPYNSPRLHQYDGTSWSWYYGYVRQDILCRCIQLISVENAAEEDFRLFDRILALAEGTDYDFTKAIFRSIESSSIYAFDELLKVYPETLDEQLTIKSGSRSTTALLPWAVRCGADEAFIFHLLDLGADKSVTDSDGQTAYEIALTQKKGSLPLRSTRLLQSLNPAHSPQDNLPLPER